jgi:signal transduction histidine kinase
MWLETPLRLLFQTSGFRLALRSLGLSLCGALLVFFIIHHAAELAWRGQIDDAVRGARSDILSDLQRNKLPLADNVRLTLAEGGGLFYADIGADGAWRAGNFRLTPALAARWTGMQTWRRQDGLSVPAHVSALRGVAQHFADGETLFIAADATALKRLNQLIAQSFLAVFGIILALGLANGYFSARATLARVDKFGATIRDIMSGDLSRRIEMSAEGDEFDRLAASMNAMLQRIQELMENLLQVTNDIAHDLRSPLARLREHLELARARFTAPGLAEMFDEALAQLDQALEIFAAMLRIAEVEAGARRAGFAEVDVSALLAMLAESYEPSLSAAGLALHTEIAPGLTLQGDRELLTQLFANLLDNIALHAEGAANASITAASQNGRIIVTVADDGSGIPAAQAGRMVQRFARLDSSRHRPGHGLGLALAASIATLHEGSLTLEAAKPGLRVTVSLPAPG